jgi:hypothetical protein
MKRLALLVLLLASSAVAQTSHKVTLTATSPDLSASNPGTVVFYRASGQCPASGIPTGGTALSSSMAFPGTASYTDSTVAGGNTYCYYAIGTSQGGSSANSNTFLGSITISVVLTGSVQ